MALHYFNIKYHTIFDSPTKVLLNSTHRVSTDAGVKHLNVHKMYLVASMAYGHDTQNATVCVKVHLYALSF